MKHLTVTGAMVLLLCVVATRAQAQGVASSFDQLAVLVKPGDKITVVDHGGKEAKGRIARLSRDVMILDTTAGPRELGEADIAQIRQRRGDSLTNGAIIGAAAGTAYFVTMMAIFSGISDGGDVIVPTAILGGVLMAGIGAAAGVGIDALIVRRQVIYQGPGRKSRVSVSPVLGNGRKGAAVRVTF